MTRDEIRTMSARQGWGWADVEDEAMARGMNNELSIWRWSAVVHEVAERQRPVVYSPDSRISHVCHTTA